MRRLSVVTIVSGCWSSTVPPAHSVVKPVATTEASRGISTDAHRADGAPDTGFDLYVSPGGVTTWKLDGGVRTERLPAQIRNVLPGSHAIVIDAPPGFMSFDGYVIVEPSKAPKIEIELQSMTSVGVAGSFQSPLTPGVVRNGVNADADDSIYGGLFGGDDRKVLGQPTVTLGLDGALVRSYVERNLDAVLTCYTQQSLITKNWDLHGSVKAHFTIDANGIVSTATASGLSGVDACVAEVIKSIVFPKPVPAANVKVTFPFTFERAPT